MQNAKQKVALSSIAASAGLTLAKGIVGLSTGSLAILSEAAHSLIDFAATVGCSAKYFEPNKPFSSPVTHTRSTERLRFVRVSLSERAISSIKELPDPLSMAPL